MTIRQGHPAFGFAVLVTFAGGAGYVMKQHLPSLIGGTALGLGFLTAGVLVLTDTITDQQFYHGTSAVMAAIICGVGRRAAYQGKRYPIAIEAIGATTSGYHISRLLHPPSVPRYIAGPGNYPAARTIARN